MREKEKAPIHAEGERKTDRKFRNRFKKLLKERTGEIKDSQREIRGSRNRRRKILRRKEALLKNMIEM